MRAKIYIVSEFKDFKTTPFSFCRENFKPPWCKLIRGFYKILLFFHPFAEQISNSPNVSQSKDILLKAERLSHQTFSCNRFWNYFKACLLRTSSILAKISVTIYFIFHPANLYLEQSTNSCKLSLAIDFKSIYTLASCKPVSFPTKLSVTIDFICLPQITFTYNRFAIYLHAHLSWPK